MDLNGGATATYYVYNNSIDMPKMPNLYTGGYAMCGIAIIGTSGYGSLGNSTVKNNIIRVSQPGAYLYLIGTTELYNTVINNNTLYSDTAAGAFYGEVFAPSSAYTTFANWTSLFGADVNSQEIDPFVTTPSAWISHDNLHFNPYVASASAAPMAAATPIAFITTDIDNQTRSLSSPWRGCDELFTSPFVTPSSLLVHPSMVTPIIVAGGIAPYTWSLSTSVLGSLNTLSGTSVNFTAGAVQISGTITVTDSSVPAQSAAVSVTVNPTSAPLANDIILVPSDRRDMIQ
jgi:hypothetical protein